MERFARDLFPKKKGGTRKIADLPDENICRDPEHDPPSMMVFKPGVYEHTCPTCGHVTEFTVRGINL
jgi:hypothetical protein